MRLSELIRDAPPALGRIQSRLEVALARARSSGKPVLASTSLDVDARVDPTALAVLSRRRGEPWFCFEQPDRDRYAVAGLGCARTLEARGSHRFALLARRWQAIAAAASVDLPGGAPPPGGGLLAMGGFAFAPGGGGLGEWNGFAPASLLVPELSLARAGERVWVTLNIEVAPDDTTDDLRRRVGGRLAGLRPEPLPLLDPDPRGRYLIRSAMPPAHYEEAVARAVERIRDGGLEKIVLARKVEVQGPAEHDPGALLGILREAFPSCYVFAVGRGDATFLGASPELLVRGEGQRASTVALAGSCGRSADPAVDDHLGEQLLRSHKDRAENEIVVRRIVAALAPHALWVTAAPEPSVVRVANIQHLATPIRAQLADPLGAIELAAMLHPTPAVGGEPASAAEEMIPALEGMDRGWYAGPVGWTDASGDGEFCVALRCALVRGASARLYAGCGIVGQSNPAAELAESEVKLQALLPLLAG